MLSVSFFLSSTSGSDDVICAMGLAPGFGKMARQGA